MMAQIHLTEEDIRWMRWRISEVSMGVEVEGDKEQRSVARSNQKLNREWFYVVPTVGLDAQGSIYHPNLLQFDLSTRNGVGWQETRTDVPGGGYRSDPLYLLRYRMNASILKEKPYAVSLHAEKEHNTRNYDFFTRATVDHESYGGRAGYSAGPVPFSLSFRHSVEDIHGQVRPQRLDENLLTFSAYHERLK